MGKNIETIVRGLLKSFKHMMERNPQGFLDGITAWLKTSKGQDILHSMYGNMNTVYYLGRVSCDAPVDVGLYLFHALQIMEEQEPSSNVSEYLQKEEQARSWLGIAVENRYVKFTGGEIEMTDLGRLFYNIMIDEQRRQHNDKIDGLQY